MSKLLTPVNAGNLPSPVGPYSPGLVVGDFVFVSGQVGAGAGTGRVAPTSKRRPSRC